MSKKTGPKSFEKEFLDKRFDSLQKFLTAVSEHEELRSSIYFSAFLKFADHTQFEALCGEMNKSISATSALRTNFAKKLFEGNKGVHLRDFKTKEGKVTSRISKSLRDYALSFEELHRNSIPAYSR